MARNLNYLTILPNLALQYLTREKEQGVDKNWFVVIFILIGSKKWREIQII